MSGVRVSMRPFCIPAYDPLEDCPVATRHKPSALKGWIGGSFAAIRKEAESVCETFLRKGEVFAFVGISYNLTDLNEV